MLHLAVLLCREGSVYVERNYQVFQYAFVVIRHDSVWDVGRVKQAWLRLIVLGPISLCEEPQNRCVHVLFRYM